MNEPLRMSYSRDELATALNEWMIDLWSEIPRNLTAEQRDQFHRDNGLIFHFICDHFPKQKP
jgi:hypothetical protein